VVRSLACLLGALSLGAGCYASEGEPTGALCDRRLDYSADIAPLLDHYCVRCHSESLPLTQRHGAPGNYNFDSEPSVIEHAEAMAMRAAAGFDATNRSMPPGGFSQPSDEERKVLGRYLACVSEDSVPTTGHVHSH
jgi:uncharacterized membrane protein